MNIKKIQRFFRTHFLQKPAAHSKSIISKLNLITFQERHLEKREEKVNHEYNGQQVYSKIKQMQSGLFLSSSSEIKFASHSNKKMAKKVRSEQKNKWKKKYKYKKIVEAKRSEELRRELLFGNSPGITPKIHLETRLKSANDYDGGPTGRDDEQ
ncbi:hypothetical protein TNIN_467581 [Trichonephila inaurata madagascariensis]|uniref:Uncharacterized protein n=1 Tax=Trichonephila inaurata madagascariensis TaxID=2747483 RepID=A0A8X6JSH3_9ARAC|nr:hypothetical protein TNIN_467581 [Trichonephila inaurata madagascariensis]